MTSKYTNQQRTEIMGCVNTSQRWLSVMGLNLEEQALVHAYKALTSLKVSVQGAVKIYVECTPMGGVERGGDNPVLKAQVLFQVGASNLEGLLKRHEPVNAYIEFTDRLKDAVENLLNLLVSDISDNS